MSNPTRIDVHQHIVPPDYANWLTENGIKPGGGSVPNWSVEDALNMMDEHGIATGILSVSSPGVHLGNDAQARVLAREVNEFTASVVSDRPHRFGFFATLTLPDVDSAIAEAVAADNVAVRVSEIDESQSNSGFGKLILEFSAICTLFMLQNFSDVLIQSTTNNCQKSIVL